MVFGYALISVIGILDFITGYELAFSLFYTLPISFLTWFISRRHGIIAAIMSALVWLWADIASGQYYSHPLVPIWNTFIRLSFFVLAMLLLSALKNSMEHEKNLARTDHLTGALNSRFFMDLAQIEMYRLQRYKHLFTLAYFDLDNFKEVNDQSGHTAGDQALRTIVSYAKRHLRKNDIVARLGGDEFGLLLPETNQESARVVLNNLHAGLLEEMQEKNCPITFSIGALTCSSPASSPDELLRIADGLMYAVKRGGKNAINYLTYTG